MDYVEREAVERIVNLASSLKGSPLGLSKRETKRYSVFKAINALRFNNPTARESAALEIDTSDALRSRLGAVPVTRC